MEATVRLEKLESRIKCLSGEVHALRVLIASLASAIPDEGTRTGALTTAANVLEKRLAYDPVTRDFIDGALFTLKDLAIDMDEMRSEEPPVSPKR